MVSVTSESFAPLKKKPGIAEAASFAAKRELRVLQVFSVLGMGGAETWLLSLLRHFREAQEDFKVKFDILLTGGQKDLLDEEAIALGARLFYVPFTRRNSIGFVREFRRILASGNYDAIHDHQDYIAGLHFLMGAGHLPPVRIAHVHNPLYHRAKYANGLGRRVANSAGKHLLAHLATHVMGTSREIVTEYGFDDSSFGDVALGAAHCGFDVTKYRGDCTRTHAELCRELGWDGSAKIILFVGRLDGAAVVHQGQMMTHKNPAFALSVAQECIARDPTIRLVMVGSGETKRRELESRVKEGGLDQKIRLLGVRSDVARLMLGSDLLLFPSLAEGMGMVVVEAQAAGLRALASDTTPRECVVIDGMVKFLPLGESSKRWAEEALRLINLHRPNANECNAMLGDSSFSIKNSAARLLSLYCDCTD